MSDILSVSSNAVAAYQRALGTVSNNIANVGTDGYVRQETKLVENTPSSSGTVYLGTGVRFDGIRRAYDQFLETNLRNSTSDLNTQEPMVNYANRIVDIMGSDTVGLPTALDKFFSSARNLSTDPASTILRGQFLRDADGLAGRFQELSGQLDGVDTETRDTINSKLAEINTLAGQLATVNKQLGGETKVDSQPAQLLDQRDLLLTQLSKLVKINVTTAINGSVKISIGATSTSGVIVSGQKSIELGARFDETDLGRVAIIADPYGLEPQTVAGVSSGALGGLLSFREQVLQPTVSQLDFLASTVVDEVNAVHRDGIDANGNTGKDLFVIDPVIHTDAVSGEETSISRAAAGIRMALTDQSYVAAGALFRVIENDNNISGVDATLSYAASYADPAKVPALFDVIKNNPDPSAGVNVPTAMLIGQLPQGSDNWSLYLDNASAGQQMHVFTRDGRQLVGAPLDDDAAVRALMTTANGFIAGSTYSDTYLNQSGETGYKQIETFYGLMAKPIVQYGEDTQFTVDHNVLPSVRERIELSGVEIPNDLASIPADRLTLNGKALPGLLPTAPARTIQASDIALWMNRAADGMDPTIAINATTTATYAVADVTAGMYINGVEVPADATRTTLAELVSYVNDNLGRDTNVVASEVDGALVLTNATGYGGNDIHISTMDADGALDTTTSYKGVLSFSGDGDVTIGYGSAGVLGDIEQLGKPLGTYYTSVMPKVTINAQITGNTMPSGVESIPANAITLNGVSLGELDLGRNLQASDFVTWLNTVGSELDPAVTVTGLNEIRIDADQFTDNLAINTLSINGVTISGTGDDGIFSDAQDLLDAINNAATGTVSTTASALNLTKSLEINGVTITGSGLDGVFNDAYDLADQINAANTGDSPTGVSASYDPDSGAIVLSHDIEGDITIGPAGEDNALGVTDGTYSTVSAKFDSYGGIVLSNQSGADIVLGSSTSRNVFDLGNGTYKGSLNLSSTEELRVGFGTAGNPAELAKMGLRTSVYIDGATTEDLLVFVTGEGSATIAGSFDASMAAPASLDSARIRSLREQEFDVTFTSATHYQITWKNPSTGVATVLAERDYDAKAGIVYQGLKLMLNNAPAAGDKFAIDGNQDGAGNNQNMLKLIALEKKAMVGGPNGSTLAQAYETEVGKVGNFSNQATIAQKALEVVNNQAIEARDKVSGVSLDTEAADLIRFQQAYQASAKAMQVAGTLFDAILQVR